ncbi:MAG: hypothetical protein AAF944_07735 [Bacteroidota bacterium]
MQVCLKENGQTLLDMLDEKQINVDGKKLREASPTSNGNDGLYILSAWISEN